MEMTKKYWKGIEELNETESFIQSRDQEFPQSMSVDEFLADDNLQEASTARRDFLKFLGFSVAAATVAACEAPVTKAIPYVVKPENVTPGLATWYATTYYDGLSYASVLVKTREGRPIFIKGNKDYGFNKGNVNPQIVASVLGLYDSARLTGPQVNGKAASWKELDANVINSLNKIAAKKGKVTLVSSTVISPAILATIETLGSAVSAKGAQFEHVQYDAVSYAGIRLANEATFGQAVIPDYNFAKAKTIVSVAADFLSTWVMATEYQHQYAETRNPDGEFMSKHFQFESIMSLSGSNADYRGLIKPSEQAAVLAYMLGKFGVKTSVSASISNAKTIEYLDLAVAELKKSGKNSLVVSGSNNKGVQILTNKLNAVLGAYSTTINLANPVNLFASEDAKMQSLVSNVISGKQSGVIFLDTNPVYSLANGKEFGAALSKLDLSLALSLYADETAAKCANIAPVTHALESWNDYQPKANHFAVAQPTIRPLFDSAHAIESFLVWSQDAKVMRGGKDSRVAFDYIKEFWATNMFAKQAKYADVHTFWNKTIHDSCFETELVYDATATFNDASLSQLGTLPAASNGVEVVFYQKGAIGTGIHAGNPWLQEMADPISKVTWDNYITMAPVEMKEAKYAITFDQENGLNLAKITVNGVSHVLPVYPSPGQAVGTVGVALGYGRGENNETIGHAAYKTKEYGGFELNEKGNRIPVGANAFRMVSVVNGTYSYDAAATVVQEGTALYPIAATQIHHTVMGRSSVVRETTLDAYKDLGKDGYNPAHMLMTHHGPEEASNFDLWDAHPVENIGHRWAMTIDLNQCFGCGSCLIACQAENNVPVVGKDEVRRGREMAWLRIDRYFSSDVEEAIGTKKEEGFSYDAAELPQENPKVIHMPMMCQHCNHAPCETVCPVAATTHSNEGLNQMTYNRCIGTRYCANNCPYKVRRFNWFNYPSYKKFTQVNPAQDDLGRMVLNPDVTVRTRGVMEKCSFCVQNLQAAKLTAKKEGRPVIDADVTTACADVCPSDAIIVGDWNDIKSKVRVSSQDSRSYQVLEEIGVKPNIWYKTKVRNEDNKGLYASQAAGKTAIEKTRKAFAHTSEENNGHH